MSRRVLLAVVLVIVFLLLILIAGLAFHGGDSAAWSAISARRR